MCVKVLFIFWGERGASNFHIVNYSNGCRFSSSSGDVCGDEGRGLGLFLFAYMRGRGILLTHTDKSYLDEINEFYIISHEYVPTGGEITHYLE